MSDRHGLLNWIEAEDARRAGAVLQFRDIMHGCIWLDSDGGEITEYCSDLEWRIKPKEA